MCADNIAIRVDKLSKHYVIFARPADRLKRSIVPRLQRLAGLPPKQYGHDFAALDGVSFEIRRGETVGIIGRNGCGKSTLLQIICGTLTQTSGAVEVFGRGEFPQPVRRGGRGQPHGNGSANDGGSRHVWGDNRGSSSSESGLEIPLLFQQARTARATVFVLPQQSNKSFLPDSPG